MNTIMPEPGRRNWADLLRLLDEVRRIAFDRSIDDADRARGIQRHIPGARRRGLRRQRLNHRTEQTARIL